MAATNKAVVRRFGPMTERDKQVIAENCETMPFADIARLINRSPKGVKKYIKESLNKHAIPSGTRSAAVSAEYDLKRSPIWKELEQQFTVAELDKFVHSWKRIYSQFKEDVLATEESQIIDYIKVDILMSRLLTTQRQTDLEIESLEVELQRERRLPRDQQDQDRIQNVTQLLGMRRSAQESVSREYQSLFDKKSKVLQHMKATREARIKNLESSKESLIGWIKKILADGSLRQRVGLEMEKMRLAIDQERNRLSQYHMYADKQADKPIYSADTAEDD